MHRNRGVRTLIAALSAVTLALAGCSSAGDSTGSDPIEIGVLLPLSGGLGGLGKQMLAGYQVAQDFINQSGGINGRRVEFKVSDAPTPEDAVGVATNLANDSNIKIIMGTNSSSIAIPASEVVERNQKVYWETGAAAADLTTRGFTHLFRTSTTTSLPAYTEATPRFLQVVADKLGKEVTDLRVGLIYANDDFGTTTASSLRSFAQQGNYNLVLDSAYDAAATDLSGLIGQLISANVEVLVAVSNINDAILIGKQSDELGFTPQVIFGQGSGWTAADTINALGKSINGVVAGDAIPLNIDGSLISSDVKPTYDEFKAAYRAKTGQDPGTPGTNGYVGAMVLFQNVLPNADPDDVSSIVESAKKVDIPDRGTVALQGVKFDSTGQNERARWYFMQFQNGKLTPVFPPDLAGAQLVLPLSAVPGR